MNVFLSTVALSLSMMLVAGCSRKTETEDALNPDPAHLAACLTSNGWIMYGSGLCSACRAQRKLFGEAFDLITEVECNPNVEGAQTELCLARGVRRTPTWIREIESQPADRVEEFQLLDDLARRSGCLPGAASPSAGEIRRL